MTTATIHNASAGAASDMADTLRRAGNGDPTAWEEILRRYSRLVSSIVRSFRMQDADALDASQTTWLRLAENLHRVRHPERLAGWLATTARRECQRILRQIALVPSHVDTIPEAVADPSAGPEQRAIDADSTRRLWAHVDELSPRRRALLRARFGDDSRAYAEISSVMGIPPGGIGPTQARALRQLRDRLDGLKQGPDAW